MEHPYPTGITQTQHRPKPINMLSRSSPSQSELPVPSSPPTGQSQPTHIEGTGMDSKPDPTHIAIFPIKVSIGHIYLNILISISQLQKLPILSSSLQVFICSLLVFCARALSLGSRVYAIEREKRSE